MKLKFFEMYNKMWYGCEIPDASNLETGTYEFSEIIPSHVMKQGKENIMRYAKRAAEKHLKKMKEIDAIGNYLGHKWFYPLTVEHNKIKLKGIMFTEDSRTLVIHLLKPFTGEKKVMYGMASAFRGHYISGSIFGFSQNAIETAEKRLIMIFEEEHRKAAERDGIAKLAATLNRRDE